MRTWRAFLLLTPCLALAAHTSDYRQDRAWKRYANPEGQYCLQYPKRWLKEELSEQGITFYTGIKRYSMPTGEIDVTVLSSSDDGAQLVEAHMDGMKRFARAEHIEIWDREKLDLDGTQAMLTKDRYRDPLDKKDWNEEIIVARHDDKLYRLEMVCRDDQVDRFESIFQRVVSSFSFDCGHRR